GRSAQRKARRVPPTGNPAGTHPLDAVRGRGASLRGLVVPDPPEDPQGVATARLGGESGRPLFPRRGDAGAERVPLQLVEPRMLCPVGSKSSTVLGSLVGSIRKAFSLATALSPKYTLCFWPRMTTRTFWMCSGGPSSRRSPRRPAATSPAASPGL